MWFILYVLTLSVQVSVISSQNCTNYCWHGYDNRTGNQDNFTIIIPEGKTVSGVITFEGSLSFPKTNGSEYSTYIRFHDKNGFSQPFVLGMLYSKDGKQKIYLEGKYLKNESFVSQELNDPFGKNTNMKIQIYDKEASLNHYYSFHTNETLVKCTFGNKSNWESVFNFTQITDTGSIEVLQNDSVHEVSLMSVCNTNTPKICTKPQTLYLNYSSNKDLTCLGSGAPYLKLSWTKPDNTSAVESDVVYDSTSSFDHVISSNISIKSFSVNDTGTYSCNISNDYFNTTDTITYKIYAPFSISALSREYFDYKKPLSLEFNVSGWPFDDFKAKCNSSNFSVSLDTLSFTEHYQDRPYRIYNITFDAGKLSENITCKFKLNDRYIYKKSFLRIGYKCTDGTYGKNLSCLDCPWGQSSIFPHTECFNASSNCLPNFFGTNNCTVCPEGLVSNASSAKVQDCYKVESKCKEGQYGVEKNCSSCPFGFMSKVGAVKKQECYNATSSCQANYYFDNKTDTNCTVCPVGQVSNKGAVKLTDCVKKDSNCSINQFGIDSNCSFCPNGYVSRRTGLVKVEECTNANSKCPAGTYGISRVCVKCRFGFTSNYSAAKQQDCYDAKSKCPENLYGIGDDCTECDYGYASKVGAGKKQDCELLDSNCPANKYGFLDNCTACPEGYISSPQTRYKKDCQLPPEHRNHGVAIAIGIGCAIFIVIVLIIGFTARVVIKKRRQEQNLRVVFTQNARQSRDELVFSND